MLNCLHGIPLDNTRADMANLAKMAVLANMAVMAYMADMAVI